MKKQAKVFLVVTLLLLIASYASCSAGWEGHAYERQYNPRGSSGGGGFFLLSIILLIASLVTGLISLIGFCAPDGTKWSDFSSDVGAGSLKPVRGRRRKGKSTMSGLKKAYKANLREPFAPPCRRKKVRRISGSSAIKWSLLRFINAPPNNSFNPTPR